MAPKFHKTDQMFVKLARATPLLALIFCIFSAPLTWAHPPRRAEATKVIFEAEKTGVRISYELPHATISLPIAGLRNLPDIDVVSIDGAAMDATTGLIRFSRPLSRFVLHVRPSVEQRDSIYSPALSIHGMGYVLFAPYFYPDASQLRIFRQGRMGLKPMNTAEADGYVIVGSSPQMRDGLSVVVGKDVPATLASEIIHSTKRIMDFYRQHMIRASLRSPTIVLSIADDNNGMKISKNKGDVTDNGIIVLRFDASDIRSSATSLNVIREFLAHELFHLWNGNDHAEEADWWLQEGGAEYASWRGISSLWPDSAPMTDRVNAALRSCALYLASDPLRSLKGGRSRQVRYTCGATAYWVIDLAAARRDGGDMFDVLQRAMGSRGAYSLVSFRTSVDALAPDANGPLDNLLTEGGGERWFRFVRMVSDLGAQIKITPPSDFVLRLGVAKAVVASSCPSLKGVGEENGALYVQADASCRPFGSKSVILTVDGIDPMKEPGKLNELTRAACGAKQSVTVRIRNEVGSNSDTEIHCTKAVDPLIPDIHVLSSGWIASAIKYNRAD